MTTFAVIGYYGLLVIIRLLEVYTWVIIGNSLLSWFLPPDNSIRQFLGFITEPVVGPFRRVTSRFMRSSAIPIDISPVLAIFAIIIVEQLLWVFMGWLY